MATLRHRGDAPTVNQVTTIAVTGTWATSDTASLTINGKTLTVTIGTDSAIADVVAAIVAAWNAADSTTGLVNDESRNVGGDEYPEFFEITASGSASPITLTSDSEKPFTVTVSESTAGSGALGSPTEATAADGPSHWSAANFRNVSTGANALPANSDDVLIEDGSQSILYNLDQSGVTLTSLTIKQGYTGQIGLAKYNSANSTNYEEYRTRELSIGVTTLEIGEGDGNGSGRIQINLGSVQTAATVFNSGTSVERDFHTITLRGTHASNVLTVLGGLVDVAAFPGNTATLATVNVSNNATLRLSTNCTLTTLTASGQSSLEMDSAATTLNIYDNANVIHGAGNLTNVNHYGQTLTINGACTIGTSLDVSGGALDVTNNVGGLTVTPEATIRNGSILDPAGKITWSAGYKRYGNVSHVMVEGATVTVA